MPRNTVYICEIPTSLEPNSEIIQYEGKLGRWLDDQRKAKKGRRTHLSQEKENLLQELVDQGMCARNYLYQMLLPLVLYY